jgi:hypothetical protein
MAAGTTLPETQNRQATAGGLGAEVIEYDRYIETQLHRTRRQVKGVDISSSLMLLAVAVLAYLMLVALLDHWVVSGGLGFAGRMAAFGLLALGVVAFCVLRLAPLVVRRINPVYAAYTIERHRPGIKNSLINFLMLRSGADRVPDRIYEAMEAQAVSALTSAHAEVAVDRAPVIRLLLALVAVIFCLSLYAVLSPKSLFRSFGRVMSPWSDLAPPTRVAINDIQPGNGSGFHDQHVAVSAQLDGLRSGEPVTVRYSTLDGQVVSRPVPMTLPDSGYRHVAELPADNLGLQQDLEYWITAGDAISPHYRLKVDTAPAIVIEEIEYQYPKYTELPPRKVARHGDIQALAGTQITLRAKANQVIGQANVDFECDGRNDLDMRTEGALASVGFALGWNDKTRRAEHESYQLRFRNGDGHENPKPIRYSIEVIRDLPPEVELVEPELDAAKDLVVPAGTPVRFTVQAADPDFKLATVKFHARRGVSPLVAESLLAEARGGEFRRDYVLDLKRLALKPGEQVEFWAAADDNCAPRANHAETPHYRLRIATADEKGQAQEDQGAGKSDNSRPSKSDGAKKNQPGERSNKNQEQGDEGGESGDQESNKEKGGASKHGKNRQPEQDKGEDSGEGKPSEGDQNQQGDSGDKPQPGGSTGKQDAGSQSKSGEGEKGQGGKGGQKGGGEKSDEDKRLDPQRDAGKVIDEINKHFNNKESKQAQPSDGQKTQGKKPGEKQQPGAAEKQKSDQEKNDDKQQGEQPDDKTQEEKSGKSKNEKEPAPQKGAKKGSQEDGKQQPAGSDKQASDKQSAKSDEQPGGSGSSSAQTKQEKPGEGKAEKEGEASAGEKREKNQPADKKQGGAKNQPGGKDQPGEKGAMPDKSNEQKSGAGQGGADDQGEKAEGEKQGAKSGKKPSSGEKGPMGQDQGVANEGGDKSERDDSGGGKDGEAIVGDEQPKHADGEAKPRKGQGGQAKGAGEPDDKMKKHEGESPDQKGGDPDSKDKGEGGGGNSEGANKHGSPVTHGGNQHREKKQMTPDNKKGTSEDEAESSSESKRQSDSQGAEQGERDGGGKAGGGQKSNSEGTGAAGQNSEADQGGGLGETKGKGATGKKAGDQQKADKPTGGKPSGEKGPGTNQGKGAEGKSGPKGDSPEAADPRGHNNASREPDSPRGEKQPSTKRPPQQADSKENPKQGEPQANASKESPEGQATPGERAGNDLRGGQQRGNPTEGGQPGPDQTTPPPPSDDVEPGGEDPNQEYARKATDLALERLKDQLAKDKPDPELMEKLEWTREDIERFVQQWDRLKKSADESGPQGQAARQDLDDALRSLGLRPRGASLSGGQKRDDRVRLREGRRIAPPPEYQEQWKEFSKATAKGLQRDSK